MAEYPDAHGNGWKEWSKYVLKELDRLNDECKLYEQEQRKTTIDIAMLKVKAGIWGAVGGAIPAVIGLAFWLIKGAK